MQVPTEQQLADMIERACVRHDMRPTRLCRLATGDPNLLHDLRNKGRSPSLKVANQLLAFIAALDAEQAAASGRLGEIADVARRVA